MVGPDGIHLHARGGGVGSPKNGFDQPPSVDLDARERLVRERAFPGEVGSKAENRDVGPYQRRGEARAAADVGTDVPRSGLKRTSRRASMGTTRLVTLPPITSAR